MAAEQPSAQCEQTVRRRSGSSLRTAILAGAAGFASGIGALVSMNSGEQAPATVSERTEKIVSQPCHFESCPVHRIVLCIDKSRFVFIDTVPVFGTKGVDYVTNVRHEVSKGLCIEYEFGKMKNTVEIGEAEYQRIITVLKALPPDQDTCTFSVAYSIPSLSRNDSHAVTVRRSLPNQLVAVHR